MNQFKSTKPQHSALHWDSKFLTDSVGQGWKAEAILVAGAELVDKRAAPAVRARPSSRRTRK